MKFYQNYYANGNANCYDNLFNILISKQSDPFKCLHVHYFKKN